MSAEKPIRKVQLNPILGLSYRLCFSNFLSLSQVVAKTAHRKPQAKNKLFLKSGWKFNQISNLKSFIKMVCSMYIRGFTKFGIKVLWSLQFQGYFRTLSSECWARQPQREVVKIKKFDFSYWAWSTPWGHVLSLKTFCWNPTLSWAIRYSVFSEGQIY